MPTGRPSSFNKQIADRICETIATTPRGLDFICSGNDEFPHASTVHRWLTENADFRESYLRARERQADLIFDECLEIADDASGDSKLIGGEDETREVCNTEFVQRAKLRIDTRMRMAGKLAPKKYGDKVALTGGGPNDEPIKVQTIERVIVDPKPAD